ncbi:MAG TPA: hypothetical protein VN222_10540 [Novosphingobium sp.]|nr:hypothetical protein [Novosphingobium sp.]
MTPNHDEATEKAPVEAITPGVYAATQASPLIDLADFQAATLLLHTGIGGIAFTAANYLQYSVTHGDAADGSDQLAVGANDIVVDAVAPATITNGVVRLINAAKAAADVQKVGYIAGRRYLKVTASFAGTHATGTPIAVTVVKEDGIVQGAA